MGNSKISSKFALQYRKGKPLRMQQPTARQSLEKENRQCIEIFPQKICIYQKGCLTLHPLDRHSAVKQI